MVECDVFCVIYGDECVVVVMVDVCGMCVVEVLFWCGVWWCCVMFGERYLLCEFLDVWFVCLMMWDVCVWVCECVVEVGVEDAWEATGRECCVFAFIECARECVDVFEDGDWCVCEDEGVGVGVGDVDVVLVVIVGMVGMAGVEDDARRVDVRSRLTFREFVVEKKSVF